MRTPSESCNGRRQTRMFAKVLDKTVKARHNLASVLITNQQTFFKNQQPISVGVWQEKATESQDSRSLDQTLTVDEDEIHLLKFTSIPLSEFTEIELKSLILAQIERWRHALHMQVER